MFAKEMLVRLRQKLIFCKFGCTAEQPKRIRFHDGRPEPDLRANGAIAANASLAQVDVRFKSNHTAMATAMISLHFRSVDLTKFDRPPQAADSTQAVFRR